MAASGSYTYDFNDDYNYIRFSWEILSQSTANNTSTISWTVLLGARRNGAFSSTASKDWEISFESLSGSFSTYHLSGTNRVGVSSNTVITLASGSNTFAHAPDGSLSLRVFFWQGLGIDFGDNYLGSVSIEYDFDVDTIPRTSSMTVGNGTLGTSQTLTISRASSTFKHKIQYAVINGDADGYVNGDAFITGTSVSWTPPLSLASENTTGLSVTLKFYLYTYTSGGTYVGVKTYQATYSIPASVKPSATFVLDDVTDIDKIYGTPVQGLSRIKITVTGTPSYGAPIKSYRITANDATYNTAEATTGTLKTSGSSPVTATVTDTRGRSGSVSYTMNVKAYDRPNVSELSVHRCDADGNEDDQGEFIRVLFSAAVTNIGGQNKNTAAYKLRYKRTTETDYTEITFTDLAGAYTVTNRTYIFAADSDSSYDVEVEARDSHATTVRNTSASTAFTLMNWGADGTSLGIGKVAEQAGTMEVALNAEFTGRTVQIGNRYSFSTAGEAGIDGYILMARITITAANADTPITFVFSQRRALTTMTVHVQLNNSTATASSLGSIRYEGTNYGAFLVKAGELIWDLYVLKGSEYDTITLQDWYTSRTMEARVKVTFPGTLVGSLPADWYRATPAALDSLRDYIYPVGSVYISYSHVSPADLFGGTWERIENAFLWGTTSGGTIGQTGGERTHTLTVNEMPAHSHGSVYSGNVTGTKTHAWLASGGSSMAYGTVSTGGGAAHNNMPPYVQVSIWRRTA
jgi:hypothetical protein